MKYSEEFNHSVRIKYQLDGLFRYEISYGERLSIADYYMTSKFILKLNFCYDNLNDILKQELLTYLYDKNEILEIEISEQKRRVKNLIKSSTETSSSLDRALLTGMKSNYKGLNKWLQKKNYNLVVLDNKQQFQFTNNFDKIKVSEEKVYEYFYKALVEPKFLSEEDLEKYISEAFDKLEKPKNRYSLLNNPDISKIRNIFYTYYVEIASKPHGEQKKYATLLGEYFNGYNTEKVVNNFSKAY